MFRNRGEIPEINFNENNDNNDNNENNGYNVPHYTHYPRRNFFIICYDWHFFAIEVVTTLVAIVIAFGIYLFAYKVDFNDPLENVKNGFLVSQLLAILVAGIVVTGLNGIKLLNEKDAYIEKCVEAYTHFKIKTIVYMILHTIEIIVLIYLIYGISKKDKMSK